MRTGLSYMGHHNPRHIKTDLEDIRKLGCSDILVSLQENDFLYMRGKLDFIPPLAREYALKPIAIFWGVLNPMEISWVRLLPLRRGAFQPVPPRPSRRSPGEP